MHATSYQSLLRSLSSSPESSSSAFASDSADESLATLLRAQTDTVRLFLDPLPTLTLLILCFQRKASVQRSFSDVTFNHTLLSPKPDGATTDAISCELVAQKISKKLCEQYSTQGSRIANKIKKKFSMSPSL